MRFFDHISAESNELNAKIVSHAERMGRITKEENPVEFDLVMKESAADLACSLRELMS